MNPILPLNRFIPDVEARVWDDGRIYMYGSLDIAGAQAYCSHEYRVFSSADMARWTDHGVSFRSIGPENSVPWATALLYAPDCVRYRDRYHLFFCTDTRREGVAVSDSPSGPFTGTLDVGRTGGWQDWRTLRCPVAHVDGVHALYLVFRGPVEPYRLTVMSLRRFRFGIGSSRRPYGLFGSCSCDPAVGGPVEDGQVFTHTDGKGR